MIYLLLFYVLFFSWFLRCNAKTFNQRADVIGYNNPQILIVPYKLHLWHLFTFRDPFLLYKNR